MSKKHIGSNLDDFLQDEGAFDEAHALAIKEVVVWQLTEVMAKQSLSKARLAVMLKKRSQVDRLLDPTRDVTVSTLQRAAALVGRRVQIELVLEMHALRGIAAAPCSMNSSTKRPSHEASAATPIAGVAPIARTRAAPAPPSTI